MQVDLPDLSRAQMELLITWQEDPQVVVSQQVAARNDGLSI